MVPALTPGPRGEGAEGAPSPSPSGRGSEKLVDAKYPALMFKQSLAASVEKLFSAIRDSVVKDVSPALNACIQVCPWPAIQVGPTCAHKGAACRELPMACGRQGWCSAPACSRGWMPPGCSHSL